RSETVTSLVVAFRRNPGEVEAGKIKARVRRARLRPRTVAWGVTAGRNVVGIEAVVVVDLTLLFVAQVFVGCGNLFELFFGGLVAGVDVRGVLAGQVPLRLA